MNVLVQDSCTWICVLYFSHRVMMLMVVVIVVLVGDQGEESLHQVKEVDPAQHHQHFGDVVGDSFPVVVVM